MTSQNTSQLVNKTTENSKIQDSNEYETMRQSLQNTEDCKKGKLNLKDELLLSDDMTDYINALQDLGLTEPEAESGYEGNDCPTSKPSTSSKSVLNIQENPVKMLRKNRKTSGKCYQICVNLIR